MKVYIWDASMGMLTSKSVVSNIFTVWKKEEVSVTAASCSCLVVLN